jgi:mannosyltransferase
MKSALSAPPYYLLRSARTYGPLLAILFLGAFLRIYQLGTESLWLDEVVSGNFARLSLSEIIEASKTDNNFPSYYLILHYWVALFGDSEASLRLPSALFGILAVFVVYKVGELLFSRGTGLMASLILAVSRFHISYSQEARVYELMALLTLLSFYFFIKLLEGHNRAAQVGYVLFTSALMYSHVYGLFVVLTQNLYFATMFLLGRAFGWSDEARIGLGRWIVLQALLLAIFIPGLVLLAGWFLLSQGQEYRSWLEPPSLWSVFADLVEYSGSAQLLVLLLAFSLLAAVGLVRSGVSGKLYLLLLWLLVPLALPIGISIFSTPMFHNRYAIVATPALYLLAAKGVEVASGAFSGAFSGKFARFSSASIVWLAAAAVLILVSIGGLWGYLRTVHDSGYFNTLNKAQAREVAQYVDAHAQPDDLVLLYPGYNTFVFDHYSERTDIKTEPLVSDDATTTKQSIEPHDRVWAIVYIWEKGTPNDLFYSSFFEGSHAPIRQERYNIVDVTLYEK